MKPTRILATMTILLFAIFTMPFASAVKGDGYFGVGIGEADADISVSDFNDGSLISASLDETDSAWKLFGGFQLLENLAVEGGFVDLGEATLNSQSSGVFFPFGFAAGPVRSEIETDGWYVAGVVMQSFPKWSVFGKFGLLFWESDGFVVDSLAKFDLDNLGLDDDGTSIVLGFGGEFRPTEKIAVRGEWERYQDALVDERDIDLLSISVVFRR